MASSSSAEQEAPIAIQTPTPPPPPQKKKRVLSKSPTRTTSSSTSSSSSSSRSMKSLNRNRVVKFDTSEEIFTVDKVPFRYKHQVYYDPQELQRLRQRDIQYNRQAQSDVRYGSIESEYQTWRGLEDAREDICTREKSEWHVRMVLKEIQRQRNMRRNYIDEEQVRLFSKTMSRQDKLRAQKMGAKDAAAAGIAVSKTLASRTTQNISRSFNWLRKAPVTSISGMAKKIAVSAC